MSADGTLLSADARWWALCAALSREASCWLLVDDRAATGFQGCSAAEAHEQKQLRCLAIRERERSRLCITDAPRLHRVCVLRQLWSGEDCDWLLRALRTAAAQDGWHTSRHRHYATTDYPIWGAAEAAAFVRRTVELRVLPCLYSEFGLLPGSLVLHESFLVR
jgi:hypothetical protein